MSYEVHLRPIAKKQLDSIAGNAYNSIDKVISALENNPRPINTKKLTEIGLWRVRAGNYGIIYAIDDDAKLVTIVRIAKRSKDTYKSL